jgi:hypothetical protein
MCGSNASAPPIIWINANTFVYTALYFGNPKVRSAALSAAADLMLVASHTQPPEGGWLLRLSIHVHAPCLYTQGVVSHGAVCVTELARKKVTIPRDPFQRVLVESLSLSFHRRRCHYAIMVNLWSRDAHRAISFAVQSTLKPCHSQRQEAHKKSRFSASLVSLMENQLVVAEIHFTPDNFFHQFSLLLKVKLTMVANMRVQFD